MQFDAKKVRVARVIKNFKELLHKHHDKIPPSSLLHEISFPLLLSLSLAPEFVLNKQKSCLHIQTSKIRHCPIVRAMLRGIYD